MTYTLKVVFFLVKVSFINSLDEGKILRNFSKIIVLVNVVVASLLTADLYDSAQKYEIDLSPSLAESVFYLTVYLIPVLLNIFPFYRFKNNIISPIHPLKIIERTFVEILYDFCSWDFLTASSFIVVNYLISDFLSMLQVFCAFLVASLGFLSVFILRLFFEKRIRLNALMLLMPFICILMALCLIYASFVMLIVAKYSIFIFLNVIFFLCLYLLNCHEEKGKEIGEKSYNIFISLYWRRKEMRRLVLGYVSIKLILLSINFGTMHPTDDILLVGDVIFPLVSLISISGNFFGIHPFLWLVTENNSPNPAIQHRKNYISIVAPLFIFDSIVTMIWAAYAGYLQKDWIFYYLTNLLVNVFMGYFVSVFFSYRVRGYEQDSNVVVLGLLMIAVAAFLLLSFRYPFLYIINVSAVIISAILFWKSQHWGKEKKYITYSKLFKR